MKAQRVATLHKFDGQKNYVEAVEYDVDTILTKFNLEAHQCLNAENIITMRETIENHFKPEGKYTESLKGMVIGFLDQLLAQREKLDLALRNLEDELEVGERREIR